MSLPRILTAAVIACAAVATAPPAAAQNEAYIGEIRFFAGTFAPRGWAFCDGNLLAISENSVLFAVIGTTYGGDGKTTFALPDMRGRLPVHHGQGPGFVPVAQGERGGSEQVTLTVSNLPRHTHQTTSSRAQGPTVIVAAQPPGALKTKPAPGTLAVVPTTAPTANVTSTAGKSQPVPIRNPYIGLNCIIAIEGYFPSRN